MLLHGHRGLEREPQGPGVQLAVNGGWGSPYQCWISKMKWSLTIFCTISAVACEFMLPPVFGFRMCLHVHITWNFSGLCGTACENMTWNWPVDAWVAGIYSAISWNWWVGTWELPHVYLITQKTWCAGHFIYPVTLIASPVIYHQY